MKIHTTLGFILSLIASPMSAECLSYGTMKEDLKTRLGQVLVASGTYSSDGRKIEIYTNQYEDNGTWTAVIVWRPKGVVKNSSCVEIIGESDVGVFIPPFTLHQEAQ